MFIGDLHIRGTNPRSRKDNYFDTLKAKLRECWQIAKDHKVDVIIQPGDVFHTPEVSITTLLEAVEVFKECPVPFYCTPGNHDLFGYSLDSYSRTSLRLLQMLSNIVVYQVAGGFVTDNDDVMFKPYTLDIEHTGYNCTWIDWTERPVWDDEEVKQHTRIIVVHGMLLDHDLPYQAKYTNLHKLETNADIILSGHDHVGFGVIKRDDGKLFVNPGALMRSTASKAEMERTVQVAIIDTDTRTAELVPLKTAKPADEVLDRTKIEANLDRQYAMEEFSALIKTDTGHAVMNIPDIVENIAKQEDVPETVVKKTLELLEVKDSAKG